MPNLSRAVELGLADPRTRYVLAVALEEAGEADKAEREVARVIELEPLHHDGLTLAAHLQIAKGRIAEARATLERQADSVFRDRWTDKEIATLASLLGRFTAALPGDIT